MLAKVLAAAALAAATASAEPRALILGVSQYKKPIPSLPGIDKDVANMRQIAELMGFGPSQIRVLTNSEVTVANIRLQFQQFLSQAGPEDRVLIYFSGHGAWVPDISGDEADGRDEIWVTAETTVNAKNELENYLLDDDVPSELPVKTH